jgi:ABC-type uncharacterized transport system ATPase component
MEQSKIALKVVDLLFSFDGTSAPFFKNLNAHFEHGKIHFVRGSNGVGKSTLFRLLQGRVDAQELVQGDIMVNDMHYHYKATEKEHPSQITTVKMVQQKFDRMLADQLTFEQNLRIANLPEYPNLQALPAHQPLPELIKRFSIPLKTPVYLLSGGQRQILAILMALQKPAEVLLLDEPTAALDDKNADMVMKFLTELVATTQLTVLIICHDKELVYSYAQSGHHELQLDSQSGLRTIEFVKH